EAAKAEARSALSSRSGFLHFRFDRTLTGQELAAALKTSLERRGIDPDNVMVRTFSKDRLQHAISSATDRDNTSNVGYHGETDGKVEWMRGLGIWSNTDVTYASPLSNHISGGADATEMGRGNAYVIYDKRHLYKVGYASNGFHAFLTSPHHALIGFMSDQGQLALERSTGAKPRDPGDGLS
ncbi:MAG: hypothetical protein AAF569_06385, partial [Pseudomonadota bacterium]